MFWILLDSRKASTLGLIFVPLSNAMIKMRYKLFEQLCLFHLFSTLLTQAKRNGFSANFWLVPFFWPVNYVHFRTEIVESSKCDRCSNPSNVCICLLSLPSSLQQECIMFLVYFVVARKSCKTFGKTWCYMEIHCLTKTWLRISKIKEDFYNIWRKWWLWYSWKMLT